MSETQTTTPAATPTPPPVTDNLTEYRQQKANPPAPAPVDDPTPDPEVEADPELAKEIDALEAPKDNETPQEKAARTKRHKEAARRGYQTRLKNTQQRLAEENRRLREELETSRRRGEPPAPSGRPDGAAPGATPSPAPADAGDPNDPEPSFEAWAQANTLEAFMAKHSHLSDPYAAWQAEYAKDVAKWMRRQEQREATAARRAEAERADAASVQQKLQAHAQAGKAKYPDFDETLSALEAALGNSPANAALARFVAHSPHGGELAYRVGKDLEGVLAAARQGEARFYAYLGALEAAVTPAAKPAAPPPVSTAPAPHTPVGAGASAGVVFDPTRSNDLAEYRRAKAAGLLARG